MRDVLLQHDREPQPAVFSLKHLRMQCAWHDGRSYTRINQKRPFQGVAMAHAAGLGMRQHPHVVMPRRQLPPDNGGTTHNLTLAHQGLQAGQVPNQRQVMRPRAAAKLRLGQDGQLQARILHGADGHRHADAWEHPAAASGHMGAYMSVAVVEHT